MRIDFFFAPPTPSYVPSPSNVSAEVYEAKQVFPSEDDERGRFHVLEFCLMGKDEELFSSVVIKICYCSKSVPPCFAASLSIRTFCIL